MIQIFTQNDLIRYLYKEVTEKEKKNITQTLLDDDELQKQYCDMVIIKNQLDDIQIEPSYACIKKILNYASVHAKSKAN